ncbi:gamma-glutamyltransferase [Solimonas flava]|uniref:gamma-glutamyltransferase n=1 Tax=Solimonas flava TaxID=415849 RepID=UPI0003F7469C|nr:gamma-glutamyltransferase [Solimonas flava]
MKNRLRPLLAACALCAVAAQAAAPPTPPGYACATPHPLATQVCLDQLADGGNAVDAAVAAGAMLAVVRPDTSGLGGGGFWLLHRAADDLDVLIDGREAAPGATPPAAARSRAAAIPGAPAALDRLARRYASRPLATLLAPAIRQARDGVAVDAALARAIVAQAPQLSWAARKLLVPDGRPLAAGAVLRQPDLAATLEQLAQRGRDGFYEGPVAAQLLKAVQATGGVWSAEDLGRYAVAEREPLVFDYQGYRVTTAPPPSSGGVALAQLLGQLEILGWRDDGSVAARHLWIESQRRAGGAGAPDLGDPDRVRVPTAERLSRAQLRALAGRIVADRATPAASAAAAAQLAPPAGESAAVPIAVLDAQGNRVAATLSLARPFGSGFVAPGTGVFLNAAMDDFSPAAAGPANAPAPRKRPLSPLAPGFVEGPRGLLVFAAAGGPRGVATSGAAISAWTRGLDLAALVAAPRVALAGAPPRAQFESGALDAATRQGLSALGHPLEAVPAYGELQVLGWDVASDTLSAAADPRGSGRGAAVRTRAAP